MRDDLEQRRQQHIPSIVAGGLPFGDEVGREFDFVHRSGDVFQKEKPIHGGRGKR